MAVYLVFALAAAIVIALIYWPLRRLRRRRALAERPLPARWEQWLRRRWWLYPLLPDDVRARLHRQLQVMMAATDFYGCNGLTVTEPMRVLILAQASLMNAGSGHMQWSGFPVVLVYPEAFVREGEVMDELGLVSYERHELLGESWEQGKVVLSWADIEQDLKRPDGHCLVVHEYAHQLDGRDGVMDGTPPMPESRQVQRWARAMTPAFDDLCDRLDRHEPPPIDPYAATNPGEFFAVVSEHFFTCPGLLNDAYPDVYRELEHFYRLQPRRWNHPV